jgi:hypothetical protein
VSKETKVEALPREIRDAMGKVDFEREFPQPLCCITRAKLEAEVKAWRERFPVLYYRSMDDCIERREP